MEFNKILGHENQIQILKNGIKTGNISHCYLFEGEKGLGKKDLALAFSKMLFCKQGNDTPCNQCSSCIKFDNHNHPDFKILSPTKGIIKKSEIEELISSMSSLPFESNRKIFIIEDAHMMRTESQNALLKTLEEPPSYINIILTTSSANRLLPTILSRCQVIKLHPISTKSISNILETQYNIDKIKADYIAAFSKGSLEKSLEIVNSEDFFKKREEVISIIDGLISGDRVKAITSMDFFNENKENIDDILDMFIYWFRDLIICKELTTEELIINKDKIHILSNETNMDLQKINDIIYRIEDTRINITKNINYSLSIETMLLSI